MTKPTKFEAFMSSMGFSCEIVSKASSQFLFRITVEQGKEILPSHVYATLFHLWCVPGGIIFSINPSEKHRGSIKQISIGVQFNAHIELIDELLLELINDDRSQPTTNLPHIKNTLNTMKMMLS